MYGDFSKWPFDTANVVGPLQQQGRVLLDTQQNAATSAMRRWQDDAARAAFGRHVAAIPSWESDGFKVVGAEIKPDGSGNNQVFLTIDPGTAWADGILVELDPDASSQNGAATRLATYLGPPLETVPTEDPGAAGSRDAVVLEVWRASLSGFQDSSLLEPALGGPDTYEMLQTQLAFRLFRMDVNDTCETIRDRIRDDFSKRGHLSVTLVPTTVSAGDCPVVQGGGYSGFEHDLYRIEVADLNPGQPPMFKWSQFNGGLVGTGIFDPTQTPATLTVIGNKSAIATSGLTDCYVESFAFDTERGRWMLAFAAPAALGNDDTISLSAATFGSVPGGTTPRFFRLWNGLRAISEFPASASPPVELRDGIRLQFDAASTPPNYLPYDYWTFPVRASGIDNPQTLVDNQPPVGIHHHRVPLGVLDWTGSGPISAPEDIEDCRVPFHPLTAVDCCCTFTVGDGVRSEGDFTRIQDAIHALPSDGGRVCVLPGTYLENVLLEDLSGVILSGCGPQTVIKSKPLQADATQAAPVIHVLGGHGVRVEALTVIADATGIGLLLEDHPRDVDSGGGMRLSDVTLQFLDVQASGAAGIEMDSGTSVCIRDCRVTMEDNDTLWPGIVVSGDDIRIERNLVTVQEALLRGRVAVAPDEAAALMASYAAASGGARGGLGGIWLRGGTSHARVIGNFIEGGIGTGITLGSADLVEDDNIVPRLVGWFYGSGRQCGSCEPGGIYIPPGGIDTGGGTYQAGDPLCDIVIQGNSIKNMGLAGIGVFAFFGDLENQGIITIKLLRIAENVITGCLSRQLVATPDAAQGQVGYGGIALADVEQATICSNRINCNGRDYLQPTCGIFIVHAVGVEIIDNEILNNGVRTSESPDGARPGPRGGLWVTLATEGLSGTGRTARGFISARDGLAALRVHGNRIDSPLGRALTVKAALGSVSIVANRLATRAVSPTWDNEVAATVLIFDLGIDRELTLSNDLSILGAAMGTTMVSTNPGALIFVEPVLASDGNVMFNENQVSLELIDDSGLLNSSLAIFTLDDLSVSGNQCDAFFFGHGIMVSHLLGVAMSMRCNDNRLKEGRSQSLVSALNAGWLGNIAAANISTHCILLLPAAGSTTVKADNVELIAGGTCGPLGAALFVNGFAREI